MTSADSRPAAAVEITSVSKQYGALRPLRIEQLTVGRSDRIALVGLDQPAAEVFLNLVTGASLPDAGVINLFGRSTLDIVDSSDWLSTLDRFGIVAARAAGGHDAGRELAIIEFQRVIEPRLQHGRGVPAVLRGAQDQNDIGGARLIARGLLLDSHRE